MVINLPTNLEKATTHRYGSNSFKLHRCGPPAATAVGPSGRRATPLTLHSNGAGLWQPPSPPAATRLPVPRPGQVLGLVGTNGIGKSTALKILAGKDKPNLGNFDVRRWPAPWQ